MCDGRTISMGADRLKGILTTFYECKKYGKFYINWVSPFNLTDYLLPAEDIDWRISHDGHKVFPAIIDQSRIKKKNMLRRYVFRLWFAFKPQEMHVFLNLMWHGKHYYRLFYELFKPSNKLQSYIDRHLFGLGKYWSFSFRFNELLGDFKDTLGSPLPKNEAIRLMEKNIFELKTILNSMPSEYKAYIASDSPLFLERVKDIDSRFI